MKVGLYIPGLGESFRQESVVKYATRLKNEMDQNAGDASLTFFTKVETDRYQSDEVCQTTKVSIYSRTGDKDKLEYILYDFQYSGILTETFKNSTIVNKSWLILMTVLRMFPLMVWRLIKPAEHKNYSFRLRLQSLYAFSIFLLIAILGVLLIPSAIGVLVKITQLKEVAAFGDLKIPAWITSLSALILSASACLFALIPQSKSLITSLATEFVCVDYYLRFGERRQILVGRLEQLIEHIAEREKGCKIHFHSYSFGTILSIDALFPYGNDPAGRLKEVEALITIGCPYEFLSNYYPVYFTGRTELLANSLVHWYNIYSNSDALASNFRHGNTEGDAEYSFLKHHVLPSNIYYELTNMSQFNWLDYMTMYSIKAHQHYWDHYPDGSSCLRRLYERMNKDNMIYSKPAIKQVDQAGNHQEQPQITFNNE